MFVAFLQAKITTENDDGVNTRVRTRRLLANPSGGGGGRRRCRECRHQRRQCRRVLGSPSVAVRLAAARLQ